MSVTKLRRFLSVNKGDTKRGRAFESDEPGQEEGNQSVQSIRNTLSSQMAKSKRNGSWFRLSRLERGIVSLSLSLKVTFESSQLAKALVSVLKRLAELSDAVYAHLVAGSKLAWAFAEAAVSWGNLSADAWKHDRSYALFLGRSIAGVKGRP